MLPTGLTEAPRRALPIFESDHAGQALIYCAMKELEPSLDSIFLHC